MRLALVLTSFMALGLLVGLGARSLTHGDEPPSGPGTEHDGHSRVGEPPAPERATIDLGNEDCPVMGRPVDGSTWTVWNGLRIGHCCPPCRERFLAEPERYLAEAGLDWEEAAETAARLRTASGPEREEQLAKARERWTVLAPGEGD